MHPRSGLRRRWVPNDPSNRFRKEPGKTQSRRSGRVLWTHPSTLRGRTLIPKQPQGRLSPPTKSDGRSPLSPGLGPWTSLLETLFLIRIPSFYPWIRSLLQVTTQCTQRVRRVLGSRTTLEVRYEEGNVFNLRKTRRDLQFFNRVTTSRSDHHTLNPKTRDLGLGSNQSLTDTLRSVQTSR